LTTYTVVNPTLGVPRGPSEHPAVLAPHACSSARGA